MGDRLILKRYRPLEVKGAGGSGTVQICWDTRIQRRVAIKRIPLSASTDTCEIPGLTEARTGAMLSRSSIVTVFDFDTEGDEAFLIMEAIEGPALSQLLENAAQHMLDLDAIAAVADAVGDALNFAHENQVLHLDIKPDNILITQTGQVKVSDFGVSELVNAQGFAQACGGTVGYMSPEQMQAQNLDQRADEFSFGVLVYEMLTGRVPYPADSINASLRLMRHSSPLPPSAYRADIGNELDEVVLNAISPQCDRRFETVYDFMAALMPLLGDVKAGTALLRELITQDDEENDEFKAALTPSLWERIPQRVHDVFGRICCAALCLAILACGVFSAAKGIPAGQFLTTACVAAAIVALVALLRPPVAVMLCIALFFFALSQSPDYVEACGHISIMSLVGIGVAIGSIVFFVFHRHRAPQDTAQANCIVAPFVLAPLGIACLAPLATGFCLPVKKTLGVCIGSALVTLVLAWLTGSFSLIAFAGIGGNASELFGGLSINSDAGIALLTRPGTWILLAGWVLSAILMSACCNRQTRVSSVFGTCIACVVLVTAQVIAYEIDLGSFSAPDTRWLGSVAFAGMVMIVVGVLGAPKRQGED